MSDRECSGESSSDSDDNQSRSSSDSEELKDSPRYSRTESQREAIKESQKKRKISTDEENTDPKAKSQKTDLEISPKSKEVSPKSESKRKNAESSSPRKRKEHSPRGRERDESYEKSEGEYTDSDESEDTRGPGVKSVVQSVVQRRSPSPRRYDERRSRSSRYHERDRTRGRSRDRYRDNYDRGDKRRNGADTTEDKENKQISEEPSIKKKKEETLVTRTGGAYIPPAKLRMLQAQITDKSSVQYQRIAWEALKKSINGLVNKINISNIVIIVTELFQENIVRGRGLLSRSILQAQTASPTFTHVYAALVAIINTKFPQIGELILKRCIVQFKRSYKRNDKSVCLSSVRFIGHLVNQQVAHEVIALEILTVLLENPTDDSVEVAIGFLKECGQKLTEVSPRGIHAIFERLRSILHEAQIEKRVQYMIEVMFAIRKDQFKDHPSVLEELDKVDEADQFTHLLTLEDEHKPENELNVFKEDPEYLDNEENYKAIKKEILDEGSSGSESGEEGSSDEEDSEEEEDEEKKTEIIDQTETNLIALRRTIYLTIQSSLDFEECAHKLLKVELKPGQEKELCNMFLDCCAQQRSYEKFFGLLSQRFCQLKKEYVQQFEFIFKEQYDTCHRLETNKLRNVAKIFAHLLYTDAIAWTVLSCISLNEEDTTSSSRIFVKILFQELSEYMGLQKLNERLKDQFLQPFFEGLFPRDNPANTRFAINFFTTIGLGGLTDELRDHLKNLPKLIMAQRQEAEASDSSSDSSSGSSDSSESSEESSDSEDEKKKRKMKQAQKRKERSKEKGHHRSESNQKESAVSRKERTQDARRKSRDKDTRKRSRDVRDQTMNMDKEHGNKLVNESRTSEKNISKKDTVKKRQESVRGQRESNRHSGKVETSSGQNRTNHYASDEEYQNKSRQERKVIIHKKAVDSSDEESLVRRNEHSERESRRDEDNRRSSKTKDKRHDTGVMRREVQVIPKQRNDEESSEEEVRHDRSRRDGSRESNTIKNTSRRREGYKDGESRHADSERSNRLAYADPRGGKSDKSRIDLRARIELYSSEEDSTDQINEKTSHFQETIDIIQMQEMSEKECNREMKRNTEILVKKFITQKKNEIWEVGVLTETQLGEMG
uniref:Pre-mRNA-splicing factor CWC22 homolog n=1 Tax=Saccoglossus kowalevskii TaxID=10224 RepID=A0ABM0M3I3_SACKO|nr:PREDICTED: pre-mRNA-splicing factor CWC22 homolog [Saccoglossus kowalevskii]